MYNYYVNEEKGRTLKDHKTNEKKQMLFLNFKNTSISMAKRGNINENPNFH